MDLCSTCGVCFTFTQNDIKYYTRDTAPDSDATAPDSDAAAPDCDTILQHLKGCCDYELLLEELQISTVGNITDHTEDIYMFWERKKDSRTRFMMRLCYILRNIEYLREYKKSSCECNISDDRSNKFSIKGESDYEEYSCECDKRHKCNNYSNTYDRLINCSPFIIRSMTCGLYDFWTRLYSPSPSKIFPGRIELSHIIDFIILWQEIEGFWDMFGLSYFELTISSSAFERIIEIGDDIPDSIIGVYKRTVAINNLEENVLSLDQTSYNGVFDFQIQIDIGGLCTQNKCHCKSNSTNPYWYHQNVSPSFCIYKSADESFPDYTYFSELSDIGELLSYEEHFIPGKCDIDDVSQLLTVLTRLDIPIFVNEHRVFLENGAPKKSARK